MSKKDKSETKRDLVKTGNKKLRSETVKSLQESNVLLQLRNQIGATATGFQSKHCE